MKTRSSAFIAATFGAAVAFAFGLSATLFVVSPHVREIGVGGVIWALPFTFMGVIGALLIWRRPRNAVGWVLGGAGALMAWNAAASDYSIWAYEVSPPRPAAALTSWLAYWLWIPTMGLLGLFFTLFPTGKAMSRLWRPVVWAGVVMVVATVPAALLIWGSRGPGLREATTPDSVPGGTLLSLIGNVGFVALILAGLFSLVVRFRRGGSVERLQVKWLLVAASMMVASTVGAGVFAIVTGTDDPISHPAIAALTLIAFASIPVAAAIAILRYRLYDIDIIINKALVYGALAAIATVAYMGIVVGIGTLIGARSNLFLTVVATASIALAFNPLRTRVQRIANRIVYGERMSPYEAMSELSHQMAAALSVEEVLPRMAEAAGRGTGAAAASVTIRLSDGRSKTAAWPAGAGETDRNERVSIVYGGEVIGEIALVLSPGADLSRTERQLLEDLASQAGPALHNVQLNEELRSSRQRLVNAQNEERRRMERDIHDGAQQQLVAISVKLGLTKNLIEKDAARAMAIVEDLKADTSDALETLRDLARGLFPQALVDEGLTSAVRSFVRKMGIPANVTGDPHGARSSIEIEAAVYFVVREALQNASKHAGEAAISVTFGHSDHHLDFEVKDEGPGFDISTARLGSGLQNMVDRIEALGGTLQIESAPGEGTAIKGRVPRAPSTEPAGTAP